MKMIYSSLTKILRNLCIVWIFCFIFANLSFSTNKVYAAEDFFYTQNAPDKNPSQNTLELGQVIKQDSLSSNNTLLFKIREFFGLAWTAYGPNVQKPAIAYIQIIVNRILGLVSFIALIVTIFAFYQIFFAKWDEWVAKAKKMLIGVMIALVIMGLSRFIVSYFYNIYSITTGTATAIK